VIHQKRPEVIYNRPIDAYRLVEDEQLGMVIRAKDASMVIGHTRLGTMGANENRNAHPFKEGNVIGTHNGMVYNYSELDSALDGHKPLRVDSQVIFRLLSEIMPDGKLITEALPMIQGSLALAWHDVRDPGGLWLFKHNNPLSMAFVSSAKTAYWSSEYEHLMIAMQSVYGNNWETVTIKSDILYRMSWDGNDLMWQQFDVDMKPAPKVWPKPNSGKGQTQEATPKPTQMELVAVNGQPVDPVAKYFETDLERCNLCGLTPDWDDNDAFYDADTDSVVCGACGRWWDNHGQRIYADLKEARGSSDFGHGETYISREPAELTKSELSELGFGHYRY
jgi:hypothetical protein